MIHFFFFFVWAPRQDGNELVCTHFNVLKLAFSRADTHSIRPHRAFFDFSAGKSDPLKVAASGSGGLTEFVSVLSEDTAGWGYVRFVQILLFFPMNISDMREGCVGCRFVYPHLSGLRSQIFLIGWLSHSPWHGYLRRVPLSNDEYSQRVKFILISWCGPSAGVKLKAKLSVSFCFIPSSAFCLFVF